MYIRKVLSVFLFLIIATGCKSQSVQSKYAVAILNTPVLNTSDFESVFGGQNGTRVKLDKSGLIREMEFIAFPNTVFEILEVISKGDYNILRITTEDYPYNSSDLFIDSRFVNTLDTLPEQRDLILPQKEDILAKLNSLDGYGYMWGGNYGDGISQLLEFYQPASEPDPHTRDLWALKGVDCSGLIYQATNGSTPRNTSTLINYGEGLDIAGKSASEIAAMLQPLDLIVWSGHVIIVFDESTVIESSGDAGVHKSDLTGRLKSIMRERKAVNEWDSTSGKRFVVRRWFE